MTDSAVRITHFPTGIVVQCQNERSQHKNRDSAMKQLRARCTNSSWRRSAKRRARPKLSKLEINFGSQIRSYVLAPYRMIKDHRTKLSIGDVDKVLDGDLEELQHAFLVWRKTGRTAGSGAADDTGGLAARCRARRGTAARRQAGRDSHRDGLRTGGECAGCSSRDSGFSTPKAAPFQSADRACIAIWRWRATWLSTGPRQAEKRWPRDSGRGR